MEIKKLDKAYRKFKQNNPELFKELIQAKMNLIESQILQGCWCANDEVKKDVDRQVAEAQAEHDRIEDVGLLKFLKYVDLEDAVKSEEGVSDE